MKGNSSKNSKKAYGDERAAPRLDDLEDEITKVVDECGEDLERMQEIIRRHNG